LPSFPSSNIILFLPVDGSFPLLGSDINTPRALNTFLDLNAAPNVPQDSSLRSASILQVANVPGLSSKDNDAGVDGPPSEPDFGNANLTARRGQAPHVRLLPGPRQEVLAESSLGFPSESADERALNNEGSEPQDNGRWVQLVRIAFFVSFTFLPWFTRRGSQRPQ
jgi:hypothetical protein